MGKILLEQIEFYAYHGFFEEERIIGGKYLVDIELETNFSEAAEQDDLEATINYAEVYEAVKKEMEVKSKLIEHVAGRVIRSLFMEFDNLDWAKVKITKINPPMEAQIKSVAVVLEQKRED